MKNSIIFWNVMYVIVLIALAFISIELLITLVMFKSILYMAHLFDGDIKDTLKIFPAYHINFIILFGGIIFLFFTGLNKLYQLIIVPLYKLTIDKFNNYINSIKFKI